MCKADPPGWRYDKRGRKEWYNGGVNYNKPHIYTNAFMGDMPTFNCLYCGKWMINENELLQSEGEKVTTTD